MPSLRLVTGVEAPIQDVFGASLDIDLHLASQADASERAVAGVTSGRIGAGETVTWKARHFGITWRMTTEITDYLAPTAFTDVQVRGPFAHWRHRHLFTETDGVTEMVDEVDWAAPLGPIGRLVERLALANYMKRLLLVRNEHIVRACKLGERGPGA